ncbi:MAG: hypothetical protein ACFFD4_16570 [Candidatus Odinarchaeota archaeon]
MPSSEDERTKLVAAIKASGFPFERKIRDNLGNKIPDILQTRYIEHFSDGDVSRDLDVYGHVINECLEVPNTRISFQFELLLIGEVKSWKEAKICFYEIEKEKSSGLKLSFPNFLNKLDHLSEIRGGTISFQDFARIGSDLLFTKSVDIFTPKGGSSRSGELKSDGNHRLHETASNLAVACEYFHQKAYDFYHLPLDEMFIIHGCFPVIFVDAGIYQVVEEDSGIVLAEKDLFIYLTGLSNLKKTPHTIKYRSYLPVLITNYSGIDKAIDLLTSLKDFIKDSITSTIENKQHLIKLELNDFKQRKPGDPAIF